MSRLHGVDVSGWQAGIDTASLTADFVIVKATEGTQGIVYNPEYRRMADAALGSGKLVGFYHYANGGDPTAEADCLYAAIRAYKGRVAYALDWEGQGNRTFETGEDVGWCLDFVRRIDALMGGTCLIYMSKGTCDEFDWTPLADHPLWGAEYAHMRTYEGYQEDPWQSDVPWGAWGRNVAIHQYGFVNPKPRNGGYDSLDADIMYGTATDWKRWCGGKGEGVTRVHLGDVAALIHYDMVTDPRNGYSQAPERWGGDHPDGTKRLKINGREYSYPLGSYDCSSSVITAWRQALRYTKYEGALDRAGYTGDMRAVFVGSGLFEARYSPATRGDLYLAESKHTAMCQDGGSDGAFGYDCLSEFNRNERGGATNGQVGDQDGYESVIRGYYDDGWNTVLHYNGGADYDVADGEASDTARIEADTETEEDEDMVCILQASDKNDGKLYYFNGTNARHIGPEALSGIQRIWQATHKGGLKTVKAPQFEIDALCKVK